MTRDVAELRTTFDRAVADSRQLRADSKDIRRWSRQLVADAQQIVPPHAARRPFANAQQPTRRRAARDA